MSTTPNSYYSSSNTRYAFIDGLLCDTMEKIYATLQQQLSIPGYFGNNLDALEELLADLDWIEEEKIKLIIINKDALLSGEDAGVKEDFLHILEQNDLARMAITLV